MSKNIKKRKVEVCLGNKDLKIWKGKIKESLRSLGVLTFEESKSSKTDVSKYVEEFHSHRQTCHINIALRKLIENTAMVLNEKLPEDEKISSDRIEIAVQAGLKKSV